LSDPLLFLICHDARQVHINPKANSITTAINNVNVANA